MVTELFEDDYVSDIELFRHVTCNADTFGLQSEHVPHQGSPIVQPSLVTEAGVPIDSDTGIQFGKYPDWAARALLRYKMQLSLLDKRNKLMLLLAKQEQGEAYTSTQRAIANLASFGMSNASGE